MTLPCEDRGDHECATVRVFHAQLERALERCGPAHVVALLVVSLNRSDRLASVLDEPSAHAVTGELRERIGAVLRAADRFVMVSHDELWLMLPGLRVQAMATLAVNRLATALEPAFVHANRAAFVRPCIGIACAPQNASSASWLIQAADQAQQEARSAHLVHLVSEAGAANGVFPDDLEGALKRVLAANSLTVVYQPKVALATGRVVSVEALIRWPAGDASSVPTVLLVETAERAGLIGALTMHVLNTLLRERNGWLQQGVDLQVWINLSAHSLAQKELPQLLLQALQVWNTAPASIGLEITEGSLIRDIEQTTEILYSLQRAGFEMAIDDFGTGYSSLAYLRRFPITELKIDRMFIGGMSNSPADRQIVQSIIALAHGFGLKVVAEGAEDEATVAALEALQCDLVQGYVFAKPMTGDVLVPWIKAFHAHPRAPAG